MNKSLLLVLMIQLAGCASDKPIMSACPAPIITPKDIPPYFHKVTKEVPPPQDFSKWLDDYNYQQCLLRSKEFEICK